ncbi:hypothetical protein KJI95_19170, partial [Shewanella sp. JM162201]
DFINLRVSTQICLSYLIFKEHPVALGSPGQGCVFYAFLLSRQVLFFKIFLTVDLLTNQSSFSSLELCYQAFA